MAKKVILKDENLIEVMPITRAELVLDSAGNLALHSPEFLATNTLPGLMSPDDKQKLEIVAGNTVDTELSNTSTNPVQNKVLTQIINSIRDKYLKSAVISGNKITITDQSNNTVLFVNSTYQIVTNAIDGLVPKYDTVDGTIDTQITDWVLTNHNGTLGWYKLPTNAFKNDNTNTTYSLSGALSGNTYITTLTDSASVKTIATVPAMSGASSTAAGTAGLVPAPAANKHAAFLRGDGTWVVPTNTTYTFANGTAGNFTVTPSGGTAQTVSIGKPNTAGTADIAVKLQTARTLTIGNSAKTFDGSTDVSWDLHNILYGGYELGSSTSWDIYTPGVYKVASMEAFTGTGNPESDNGGLSPYRYGLLIVSKASNGGVAQFYISHQDSGNDKHYSIKYRTGWNNTYITSWDTILDSSNYDQFTVKKDGTGASGNWNINSATATKLSTSRKIWGLNFDGSTDVSGNMTGVGSINNVCTVFADSSGFAHFKIHEVATNKLNYIHLYVTSNTSTATNTRPLIIQKDYGNVGIGVIDPDEKLAVSGNVKATSFIGNLDGTYVNTLTGYSKATEASSITVTDSLNAALGKLEYKADVACDWITSVTAEDADEYINKWGEIVDFLDSVAEGTDITDEFVTRKTELTITGIKTFGNTITISPKQISGSLDGLILHDNGLGNGENLKIKWTSNSYTSGISLHALPNSNHTLLLSKDTNTYTIYHTGNLTNLSQLNNDSGYLTSANLKNYVTLNSAQTISGLKTFESNSSTTGVSLVLKNKGWEVGMSTAMDFYNGRAYTVPNARIETKMVGAGTAGGTLIFYTLLAHAETNPNPNGLTERFRIGDDGTSKITGQLKVTSHVITDNTITIQSGYDAKLILNNTNDESKYQYISFRQDGTLYGTLGTFGDNVLKWSSNIILHADNYTGYTVKKDGTGATGTWDITASKVTCSAATSNNDRPIVVTNTANGLYYTTKATINYSTGNITAPTFTGALKGALITNNIKSESDIERSGLRAYAGLGEQWTGDVESMGYSAILSLGVPNRGFLMWCRRGNSHIHYRNGFEDSSGWNTERIILDSANYTSYLGYIGTTAVQSSSQAQALTGITNLTMSGNLTITPGNTDNFINFSYNSGSTYSWRLGYLGTGSNDANYFVILSSKAAGTSWNNAIRLGHETLDTAFGGNVYPLINNTKTLGTSDYRWSNIYSTAGNFSGNVTAAGFIKTNSSDSYVLLGGGGHKAISDFMLKSEELTNNLTTLTKTLTVTKDWMDTGIKYNDLTTGTYAIQVYCHATNNLIWYGYWSGIMTWYGDGTNSSESDEILLHRGSNTCNRNTIYLRTINTVLSDGRHMRLQIAANKDFSSATYTFKFKKLI